MSSSCSVVNEMYQKRDARSGLLHLIIFGRLVSPASWDLKTCLHEGWGPQRGEVTCGRSSNLSCKRDQIKMRDYMDRRVTPPKRVTSPTWVPAPPCKQALRPRPQVSVFGLKTKSFSLPVWSTVHTWRIRWKWSPKAHLHKRSPEWRFLETPFCCTCVDGLENGVFWKRLRHVVGYP